MHVPQFGGWDQKGPRGTDYSTVFSQACANKKQQKADIKRCSIGNEREIIQPPPQPQDEHVMGRSTLLLAIVQWNTCSSSYLS
ncbi:hypothetical protein Ddye_022689 [Dipteronia dyeriana]|uniref:RIN4 pathogenic type III effector avirulence factor Avr cleavage site domain-containing protein n=1 Tax=Dipteronia dyeriana TaxID=168575 RepID=A0AAD9TS62_9ROSI|nr:hypothetical protein Ddye_022689 [Dipteronia dyeriana]